MKYPQLVSTRAVNAISDWLVSRLEQLGVEAPQIYARFLLSLLQSSVQINDPIEYSNLESFIASRKGNNKKHHNLPADTDILRKLTAVQCLQEIVSPDQEISNIERLVDELCIKLKDIEQQSTSNISDNANKLDSTKLLTTKQRIEHKKREAEIAHKYHREETGDIKKGSEVVTFAQQELENDPKKRYFRAFPALSKEMEDSFRILRQNAKSLTWPVEGLGISTSSSSSTSSSGIKNTENKFILKCHNNATSMVGDATNVINVKRKSRRRRTQTVKTKSSVHENMRSGSATRMSDVIKNSGELVALNNCSGGARNNTITKRQQRHLTPPYWDTDFEGNWEMGPDLIKEFITKENHRNRSTSESAAYSVRDIVEQEMDNDEVDSKQALTDEQNFIDYELPTVVMTVIPTILDDEKDGELNMNISNLASGGTAPKRLYERENYKKEFMEDDEIDQEEDTETDADFMQFKAKFNSSVEALWKDVEPTTTPLIQSQEQQQQQNQSSGPIKTNEEVNRAKLKSFWSHYFHEQSSDADDNRNHEQYANNRDYYSIPSNWKNSINRNTPLSVYFPDSIWSENSKYGGAADTDESFYFKVWNATKKLNQLDASYGNKVCNTMHLIFKCLRDNKRVVCIRVE